MPRQRNLGLTDEGRRQRERAAALLARALDSADISVAAFASQVGVALYGAPFDRSTAYRWRRLEVAVPAEVLMFALGLASMDVMEETGGRLDRIERELGDLRERLARREARSEG